MNYISASILIVWLVFSWKIAAAILIVCGTFSLFYSAAIEGGVDERVKKTFFWSVISLSVLMVGAMMGSNSVLDENAPKMCGRMEC